MEQLDENTLEEIARLVAGDDGPIYRQGWELPKFFRQAGWADVPDHDGSPRIRWVFEQLKYRRERAEDVERVILRLADARTYLAEPDGQDKAIARLNAVLVHEGYKVQRPGGRPAIVRCDPAGDRFTDAAPVELMTTLSDLIEASALATVLQSRLDEAQTCRANGAHVAAIILLGSLLEGVLTVTVQQRLHRSSGRGHPTLHDLINTAHAEQGYAQSRLSWSGQVFWGWGRPRMARRRWGLLRMRLRVAAILV